MILLSALVKYPVPLEDGLLLLQPVEDPSTASWLLRMHDPQSDVVVSEHVASWVLHRSDAPATGLLNWVLGRMLRQLDAAAWAMRKFDIPPSWQTAYYRACGEWPEGFVP